MDCSQFGRFNLSDCLGLGILYKGSFTGNQGDYSVHYEMSLVFRLNAAGFGLAGPQLTAGTWDHIVITSNGSVAKFYKNGSMTHQEK